MAKYSKTKQKDDDKKLSRARKAFEDALTHHEKAHAEAHRASRYYNNSNCVGQWEPEDLRYLRENERMALTFNILKTKVDTFLGMYADAQRAPVIEASGEEALGAEILDAVKDQLLQDANYESLSARQLKTGTIEGECSLHIEVLPSEEGEGWIKVVLWRALSYEVLWDIDSVEPDRSDARRVFWFRWFDEDDFKREYPKHADEWDKLSNSLDSETGFNSMSFGESGGFDSGRMMDDYVQESDRYYFDRKKDKIRVIRYEYKVTRDKKAAIDLDTGKRIEITDSDVQKRVDMAMKLGAPLQILEWVEDAVEVCEFIGTTILAEYDEAGPFKGFSLVPYAYEVDEETGTSYGLARNLFDPQMELNKAKSLALELDAQSTTPGTTAEEGAIPNTKAYERERRRPNGVAIVARGALTEGKIQERVPNQPSAIAAQRSIQAMELMSEVSGIPSTSAIVPAEQAQAGITVAIRFHRSRQTVSTPFSHFEIAQMKLIEKIVDVITNVMPDDQILSILGTREDLVIQDGKVIEVDTVQGPDGQPQQVPKRVFDMSDLRSVKWRLDMEYTSENSTLRMLELDMLLQLKNAGVAVDPNVMIERATSSRSVRERLKSYLDKAEQAAMEQAQAEKEALEAQGQGILQIEAGRVQETIRHNKETERLDAVEQLLKLEIEKMKILESVDDNEKNRLLEVVKIHADAKAKEKANAQRGAGNGAS